MEDDLKKKGRQTKKNGRRPKKIKWKTTSKKNGRRPQQNKKMEDNHKYK